MNMVFICHTPLHCLLSWIISKDCDHSTMVWVSDSDIDTKYLKAINRQMESDLLVLSGAFQSKSIIERLSARVSNIRRIASRFKNRPFERVVVFNDVAPEDQYMIHLAKKWNSEVWLGEDGVAIYETGGYFSYSLLEKILAKAIYGVWWRPKARIGASISASKLFASAPGLLRKDVTLAGAEVVPFPVHKAQEASILLEASGIESPWHSEYVLCILPLITDDNADKVLGMVREVTANAKSTVLKPHPRQTSEAFSLLKSLFDKHEKVLPKNFPCELLCLGQKKPTMVIGLGSSGLHLIKSFCPEIDVRFYSSPDLQLSEEWRSFYDHFGIKAWSSEER